MNIEFDQDFHVDEAVKASAWGFGCPSASVFYGRVSCKHRPNAPYLHFGMWTDILIAVFSAPKNSHCYGLSALKR